MGLVSIMGVGVLLANFHCDLKFSLWEWCEFSIYSYIVLQLESVLGGLGWG